MSITSSGGKHRREMQSTIGMNRRGTWMGFSQLKADVSHFATGKTILETATLEAQLQYYFRSCWVHSRLCCAFPLIVATSRSSISETGVPRCFFYQLDCDAKRCSSNEAWVTDCHTDTCFTVCALSVPPAQWYMLVSWVSCLSDSATQDSPWL